MTHDDSWHRRIIKVRKIVDGDTIDVVLDAGFGKTWPERVHRGTPRGNRIRFYGIDAPDRPKAKKDAATAHLRALLRDAKDGLTVQSFSKRATGKYGRILGVIWGLHGRRWTNINKQMVKDGHARGDYYGGKR